MSVGEVGMAREILDEQPQRQTKIPGRGRRWFAATGWRHVVAIAALLFALFPVWIVVIGAFSESGTLGGQTLIPESIHHQAVRHARRRVALLAVVRQLAGHQHVAAAGTVLLASRPPTPSRVCGSRAAGPGCSRCC